MPKMGESISEATIISWLKNEGDFVEAEEIILEVATDKVDNDVPSLVSGVITEIRFQKDAIVEVGAVLALINSELGSEKIELGSKKEQTNVEASSTLQNRQPTTDNQQPTTNNRQFFKSINNLNCTKRKSFN